MAENKTENKPTENKPTENKPTETKAAKKSEPTVYKLVDPKGRSYSTTDRVEVTNLRARGYKLDK